MTDPPPGIDTYQLLTIRHRSCRVNRRSVPVTLGGSDVTNSSTHRDRGAFCAGLGSCDHTPAGATELRPSVAIGLAMLMTGLAQVLILSDNRLGWMFVSIGMIELIVVFVLDRIRGRKTSTDSRRRGRVDYRLHLVDCFRQIAAAVVICLPSDLTEQRIHRGAATYSLVE